MTSLAFRWLLALNSIAALLLAGHAHAETELQPRVYIHYRLASQAAGADAFREVLDGRPVGGKVLSAIIPTGEPRSEFRTTILLCETTEDCAFAKSIASEASHVLGRDVRVDDRSKSAGPSRNRPFHYEIWFDSQPITLAAGTATTAVETSGSRSDVASNPQPVASPAKPPTTIALRIAAAPQLAPGQQFTVALPDGFVDPGMAVEAVVDGAPAAVTLAGDRFAITVPDIDRSLFSTRDVRFHLVIGGRTRVLPTATITLAPSLSPPVWVLALVGVVLAFVAWKQPNLLRSAVAEPSLVTGTSSGHERDRVDLTGRSSPDQLDRPSPTQQIAEVPEELVQACAHAQAILYIGPAIPSLAGVPSYPSVIRDLAQSSPRLAPSMRRELTALVDDGRLDTVTDVLLEWVGYEEVKRHLAERLLGYEAPSFLKRIAAADAFVGYISPGFDDLASRAAPQARKISLGDDYDFAELLRDPSRFVLQLRGGLASSEPLRLTTAEFSEELDRARNFRSAMQGLFASRTMVFAGGDTKILADALETAGIRGRSGQQHYALVSDASGFDSLSMTFDRNYGITLIAVAPGDLPDFLERLAHRAEEIGAETNPSESAEAEPVRVGRVRLTGIGPFDALTVDFRKPWTMLLGNNGAGKSTVLRAIAMALSGTDEAVREAGRSLVRRNRSHGSIEITLTTRPTSTVYRTDLSIDGQGRLLVKASVAPLQAATMTVLGFSALRGPTGTGSDASAAYSPSARPLVSDVIPLIAGKLDDRGQSLREWIFKAYAESQDNHLKENERFAAKTKIESLFALIDSMAPGFALSFARVDVRTGEILLKTSDGEVPIDMLSQGILSTIGWLGPLIQRLYEIHGASPEQQPAILLIDEIDSHLHPEWQQRLVPSLKKHFPNLQVIATTHSPLMVGNLGENEVVRIVRDNGEFKVDYLVQSFIGYRFDQILTDSAFGLERARSDQWHVRERYIELLGKSKPTEDEEAELRALRAEITRLPAPYETPAEWQSAADRRRALDVEIARLAASTPDGTDRK